MRIERGPEGLALLQADWNSIVESLPQPAFHQSFEWHRSALVHLSSDPSSVHFFVLCRGPEAVAIFPLQRVTRRLAGVPIRAWESPTDDHMPLCDFVQRADVESDGPIRVLLRALRRESGLAWDVLSLPRSVESGFAMNAVQRGRWPLCVARRAGPSMFFDCTSYEGCLERMDGHFRRNLKRQRKKLDQLGRVDFVVERDSAPLANAFEEFLRLEQSGWKGAAGRASAIALDARLRRFYESLRTGFCRTGQCFVCLLKIDGRPIASQFCILSGGTLNLLKIAYDETYAAEAPGSQLLDALLRYCCDSREIARLSLVTGPEWGVRWRPATREVWNLAISNSTVRGLMVYALQALRTRAGAAVGRWRAATKSRTSAARP